MGWNAMNRLVIARDVRPGQQIQLAVSYMTAQDRVYRMRLKIPGVRLLR
jgi:hypothetical protein